MGQSFSTNGQKPTDSAEQNTEKKVDYYELLQVEQNASGEEIKKAYRKKALELHPDRNYGNVEAATKLFAEIQSAYEVLSDPQERAWYDSHRDAFLGDGGKSETNDYSYDSRMTTSDDILKLFSKFSPRMDFSDSQSGFYGGLRETFARLAQEEEMACRSDNIEFVDYPTFGSRDDDFEDIVRPFYAVWSGFSTKKSFAWKDVYRYSEAPDRRVRRLMEKENRRLREEGIREFNEAVRSLVAFVKKRDPRYKSSAQSESQRQETLRQTAAAQAARSRAANQAKLRDHVMPDWAKSDVLEEDDTDSSEAEIEQFECVVCCKDFKSLNQLEAHERSKKHIKAVKQLRWEMRAQDEQLDLNEDALNYGNKPQTRQGDTNSTVPQSNLEYSISQLIDDGSFNNADELNTQSGMQTTQNEYGASSTSIDISTDDSASSIITPGDDAVEYTPGGLIHDRQESETVSTQDESDADTINSLSQHLSASDIKESPSSAPRKIGKAKQKRARKAAQQAMEQSADVKCSTCNASFPSRTQLFSHIKKFNHAKPQGGVPGRKKP